MKKIVLSLSLLLTACSVGPDYHMPDIGLPSGWISPDQQKTVTDEKATIEKDWWKRFDDPTLDALIDKADSGNFDLKIAEARITQARAGLAAAKAGLLPTGDVGANAERQSNRIAFPGAGPFDLKKPFNTFQAGFDASWELDVFGGQRRDVEAQRATYESSLAARDDARVSLLAEVARTYVGIRQYQQQVEIIESIAGADQKTVDLTNQRFNAGSAPGLDVTQAKAQLAQDESQLPHYRDLLLQSEYSMDVLLGEQPGATQAMVQQSAPVPYASGQLVLAAPSAVIANRPDIREAERKLAAATAQQGVAVAKFFPDVSLSGFLGLLSTDANHFVTVGNKSWSETGNVMLPILNYGTLSANLKNADAQQQEALASYQKSIISALSDVERAVSDYQEGGKHRDALAQTATDDAHAADIARQRYQAGQTSFIELLDAQRTLYMAQSQEEDAVAMDAQNMIAVYKSLGGGWK